MALITRLSRLMRADLHAVLDRVEEPEVLLRQALREMQEELARDQQRQRLLGRERDQLDARAAELEQALEINPANSAWHSGERPPCRVNQPSLSGVRASPVIA